MKDLIEKLKVIDKRLWVLLGIIILVFFFAFLISKLVYATGNSNKSYGEVETIMKNAAMKYYAETENKSSLPEDGSSVSVGDTVLSDEGYMKPLRKLIKDKTCTGKVTVTKDGINYIYASHLDCGKDYKTIEFYNKVMENAKEEADGLYQDGNNYIFRGENPDNYVKIDDVLWRIVSVFEDNTIELVSTDYVGMIKWDDRYNSEAKYQTGYNDFSKSRLKESLEDILENNVTKNHKENILPESLKDSLIPVNNCTDKVDQSQTDFNNCTSKNSLNISAISISEYIKASLDADCNSAGDKECQNYNYLASKKEFLTITGNANNSKEVYYIRINGIIKSSDANSFAGIYPVIRIPDSIMYVSGNGTIKNPYTIR